MTFSLTMPALGESVTEGTVTRWLKKEGDQIAVDEPLLEVSTDKVDTEIPSPVAGTLQKIVVPVDTTVSVGAQLAVIAESSSSTEQKANPQIKAAEQPTPAPTPAPTPISTPSAPTTPATTSATTLCRACTATTSATTSDY